MYRLLPSIYFTGLQQRIKFSSRPIIKNKGSDVVEIKFSGARERREIQKVKEALMTDSVAATDPDKADRLRALIDRGEDLQRKDLEAEQGGKSS